MSELVESLDGWPLAATLALTVTFAGVRAGRRRSALNEALHELRRPLQAIWLTPIAQTGAGAGVAGSLQMATAALERLDHAINGGTETRSIEPVPMRPLLEAAVLRWKACVNQVDGTLALSWCAGASIVLGDQLQMMQAIDNLIVNAIEHGGPSIAVEARRQDGRLRVSVTDSGRTARRGRPAHAPARPPGRRRRGHGLAVVRRVAAAHGGRFALHRAEAGAVAVLELPLAPGVAGSAA